MHAVADCRCCDDGSHRVCCGTCDIEVLTVPESAAVPVARTYPRRVSDSVGWRYNQRLTLRRESEPQAFRPRGSVLCFGVTANLCLKRLRDPARDYCSLVDVAIHQILAVMITTTWSDAQIPIQHWDPSLSAVSPSPPDWNGHSVPQDDLGW